VLIAFVLAQGSTDIYLGIGVVAHVYGAKALLYLSCRAFMVIAAIGTKSYFTGLRLKCNADE